MAKKRFRIKDKQGNIVDYDISAASVTLDVEGKSLEVKLTEIAAILLGQVKRVVFNGNPHIAESGVINLGNQMQPDWSESSTTYPSFIRNKPNFATVATSGSYNDLNDKPTIPDGVECDSTMSGTSEKPVQNKVIKAYVDNLINNLINGAPAALDTLKELADALGDNNDAIVALTTAIAAKISGIKVNGTLQTPDTDGNVNISTPTKTSDLINDRGFVTAESLDGIVAGSADFVITEDDEHIYINLVSPTITVSANSVSLSESTKSGTFKVSGTHLKGNVTLSTSATNWTLQVGAASPSQSVTLSPTNGTLAETTVTVAYSGDTDSTANVIAIESSGSETVNVTASYTVSSSPTIFVDSATHTVEAGVGGTATENVVVTASNLTGNITANISGTGFNVSPASVNSTGGTFTVTYSPSSSGTNTGTLTLSSSGASDVTVTITGTAHAQSLSLTPATLDLSSASGTPATGTVTIKGSWLVSDVTLSEPTGFTAIPAQQLSAANINAAGNTGIAITITADTSESDGSLTATSGSTTATAALTWAEPEQQPEVGDVVTKNGINYSVLTLPSGGDNGTVTVANGDGNVLTSWAVATNKYTMSSLVIPDSITIAEETYDVTKISFAAFGQCTAITSVTIGANVKTIDQYAFYGCNNNSLTSVTFPESVTAVKKEAFNETKISSYTILTTTSFGGDAWTMSTDAENVTKYVDMGTGVSALSTGCVIGHMKALETLILRKSDSIVTCTGTGSGWVTFYGRTVKKTEQGASYVPTKVYVPSSLKSSYESNTNWAAWVTAGIIEIDTIENMI